MKTNIFIIALIFILSFYLVMSFSTTTKFPETETMGRGSYKINIEKVSNNITEIPKTAEINYFETDKDINNWFVFVNSDREKERKAFVRSKKYISQGDYSAHLSLRENRSVELVLVHFPENWGDYRYLLIDITNSKENNEPIEIKIGDYFDAVRFYPESQKFHREFDLKSGLNNIKINIDEIKSKIKVNSERKTLHLCFPNEHGINLFLDNLRLEE